MISKIKIRNQLNNSRCQNIQATEETEQKDSDQHKSTKSKITKIPYCKENSNRKGLIKWQNHKP